MPPLVVDGLCKFVKSCRNSMFGGVRACVAALAGLTTEGGQELGFPTCTPFRSGECLRVKGDEKPRNSFFLRKCILADDNVSGLLARLELRTAG